MSIEKSDDFDPDARLNCSKIDSTYLDHMFLCKIGFVRKCFFRKEVVSFKHQNSKHQLYPC